MPVNIIFLIGMPGAGKSYWGVQLCQEFNLPCIDLDDYIAEKEHAGISELFAQYGEVGFREREHKYLKEVIKKVSETTIVACGGGAPCFHNNMRLMKNAGTVIYLDADTGTLMHNLQKNDIIRPTLSNQQDLYVHLEGLRAKRKFFYEQAHYILHTKDISLTTFGEILSSCINRQ